MDDEALLIYLKMLLDAGCKFKYRTEMFGKPYVWMTDPHGTWFVERIPDEPVSG
jgi:hypothetical protein